MHLHHMSNTLQVHFTSVNYCKLCFHVNKTYAKLCVVNPLGARASCTYMFVWSETQIFTTTRTHTIIHVLLILHVFVNQT